MLKPSVILLGALGAIALTACAKEEAILPGEREDIREVLLDPAEIPAAARAEDTRRPLACRRCRQMPTGPKASVHRRTRTSHPALSASPRLAWSVSIGAGDGRKNRITADPVVGDGRVFTLDAQARVTAVSTGGQVLWSTDLVPPNDSKHRCQRRRSRLCQWRWALCLLGVRPDDRARCRDRR